MGENIKVQSCVLLLTGYWFAVSHGLQLGEDNVCQETRSYMEDYVTTYKSLVREKTYTWCLAVPPRCTKYKNSFRISYKKAKRLKYEDVFVCCKGYEEKGDKCEPVCSSGCVNGLCIAPGVCDCHAGWRGISCDSECPVGTWGQNCAQECQCENEGRCHVGTGVCSCRAGFHGPHCQFRCPNGYFGEHCSQLCQCLEDQGVCDPVSGKCQCLPGYQGPLCEEECSGSYGEDCELTCSCQNEARCLPEDGSCICTPGWMGPVCANTCPEGYYGYQCKSKCRCYNGGTCDHVTGKCQCADGFIGARCQVQCPYNRYGQNCSHTCLCDNNARCDPVDGSCVCTKNFMGPHCSYRVCQAGWHGKDCKERCMCNMNSSTCDPWTGECFCMDGYVGLRCEHTCDVGWYGLNCSFQCQCSSKQNCDFKYGCVEPGLNSAVEGSFYSRNQEPLYGLVAALFLIVLILISLCLIVYYRRRYKRLKQTTQLMVQYRVVSRDTNINNIQDEDHEVECGAVGGGEDDEDVDATCHNPAHRAFSSGKKKLPPDQQQEHGGSSRNLNAERNIDLGETGASFSLPPEPPPPYSLDPENPNVDQRASRGQNNRGRVENGDPKSTVLLPPPYTASVDENECSAVGNDEPLYSIPRHIGGGRPVVLQQNPLELIVNDDEEDEELNPRLRARRLQVHYEDDDLMDEEEQNLQNEYQSQI